VSHQTLNTSSELAYDDAPLTDSAAGQALFNAKALAELQREVAHLRTAVEVLQRQNAELTSIRQAFEAERRRYREMVESAPDGYVLTTLGGVIIEANRVAAALLGVRQDFLPSKSLLIFVDDEARAGLEAMLAPWRDAEQARQSWQQPTVRGQLQLRVYRGAPFPAEYTLSPTRDEHDRIVGLRWMLRDLSENARTEQALRERDYHYRTLFDHAGDAIFIHNLTGRFLEVNRAACEFLGYSREELLRLTPADVTVPELVARIPVLIAQLQHEDHIFFEMILQRRDGTPLPMELNSRIIEYSGGPAVLSIARDITERKRGEEALARWTAQLALLSDVGRQIAAVLGVEQVLERAARLVHDNFGYHHVALFIVDRARGELEMKAIAGEFVNLFPPNHRVPLAQGMVGWVGEHGLRLLANDVEMEKHYVNFYPELIPTRSELSVPIRIGDHAVGVLDVQSPEVNAFDESDVKVMETLADQVAVAIANAQLYEEAQEARRVTGKLNPARVSNERPAAASA
jgi:PAS domain S-box-containing protein